jgi:hypothetical protein
MGLVVVQAHNVWLAGLRLGPGCGHARGSMWPGSIETKS